MTLPSALLRQAYRPIALTATIAAAAIVFAGVGHGAREQALAERNAAAAGLQRMEARLRQMEQDREEIGRQASLFRHLQTSGMVGEPHPLDWVELLENIRQDLRLPPLHYELVRPTAAVGSQDFDFHPISMRLRLQVLHEEDLLHFLERLQREAKALVLLRTCRLARLPPAEPAGSRLAHLSADCEMDWATAYKKGGEAS